MNIIHPNNDIVIGIPVYNVNNINNININNNESPTIYKWSKVLFQWFLVPLEIPSAALHLTLCMGFFGTFGNPITPMIEGISYTDMYHNDQFEKAISFFTTFIFGVVHAFSAIFTCCGCCGIVCSPVNGLTVLN